MLQHGGMVSALTTCPDGEPYRHRTVLIAVLNKLMAVVDFSSPTRLIIDFDPDFGMISGKAPNSNPNSNLKTNPHWDHLLLRLRLVEVIALIPLS